MPVPFICYTLFRVGKRKYRHLFFYPWRKDGNYHAEHKTCVQHGHNKSRTPQYRRGSVPVRSFRHGSGYLGTSLPSDKAKAHSGSVNAGVLKNCLYFKAAGLIRREKGLSFPDDKPFSYCFSSLFASLVFISCAVRESSAARCARVH